MELKERVCSLELAKRLKELKVEQGNSYFIYGIKYLYIRQTGKDLQPCANHKGAYRMSIEPTDAFTVAELGEMLPTYIQIGNNGWWYASEKSTNDRWVSSYGDTGIQKLAEDDKFEANARAKMLIYLIENKLMPTVKETE